MHIIKQLKVDCKQIFPVAEWAYTTIPTYPGGQIGFMVCCKDASRNVKVPLRSWTREEELKRPAYFCPGRTSMSLPSNGK
jgi:spermidine synthase